MDEQIMTWAKKRPFDWEMELPKDVYLWGSGSHGQLAGLGTSVPEPTLAASLNRVRQVVCGQNCTFVLKVNGSILACGEGSYGRLGQGNSDDMPSLTPISALSGKLKNSSSFSSCLCNTKDMTKPVSLNACYSQYLFHLHSSIFQVMSSFKWLHRLDLMVIR